MKKLCCEKDLARSHELKSMLEAQGIACVVKHGGEAPLLEGAEPAASLPELWIADDSQFERAWELLTQAGESRPDPELRTLEESDEEQSE
jgi:hypothetical protein